MTAARYLAELRRLLAGLPSADRDDIVREIQTHLDSTQDDPTALAATLADLGPADQLAAAYREQFMLSVALTRPTPWGLLATLLGQGARSVASLAAGTGALLGYLLAGALLCVAVGDLFAPELVGLWTRDGHFLAFGMVAPVPVGAEEALGRGVIPLSLGGAVALYLGSTSLLRRVALRGLRRSPLALRGGGALALAGLSLLLGCPSAPLDEPEPETPEPVLELAADLAAIFAEETDELGATGAAVAVWHRGVTYVAATGTTSPDGDQPVLPSTLFRIGSTTKMMTATAVLAAQDRGLLSVDDALVEHLPGLDIEGVAPFSEVTLHHLLSHTSGISEITPINTGEDDDLLQLYTYGAFANQCYMMAPAGSFWNYSNPNFSLAGAALESADGRGYRAIMREDLFEPLGMDRTFFLGADVAEDGDFAESLTYDWDGGGGQRLASAESYDDGWSRPAGFAWSSVLDMSRWGRFLIAGDEAVLSAAAHAQLIAEQVDTQAFLDRLHYGYGVMAWRGSSQGGGWYDLTTREHGGAIPGYSAEVFTIPSEGLVLVTLAAGDGAYYDDFIAAVWEELLGASPGDTPDPQIDPADFADYVGTYEDPYNVGTVLVSLDDGDLVMDLPRLDDLGVPYQRALLPISRWNFRASIQNQPASISFLADPASDTTQARWIRHRAFVADRLAPEARSAPAGPTRPLRLAPSPLQ